MAAQAWTHRRRVRAQIGDVHALMRGLAEEVHARGARTEDEDTSVGGHLMRVRDARHYRALMIPCTASHSM